MGSIRTHLTVAPDLIRGLAALLHYTLEVDRKKEAQPQVKPGATMGVGF